jgi:4-amino-4-deoxy-L-arabinose transferase-like glycosyltransferase
MGSPANKLAFAALSLFFLGTAFAWLELDHSPATWDDAGYLTGSLSAYDALTDGGVVAFAEKSLTVTNSKPPLITLLPTPLYLLLGRDPRAARLVNLVFLLLTFAGVYGIASRHAGAAAGLLAVYIAGTMPMIYGFSRWFLTECALTALVCACFWLLVEIEREYTIRNVVLLGVACGLGLLVKASFPLYVAAPLILFIWTGRARRLPMAVPAFAVTVALLAAPWYAVNLRSALATTLRAGSQQTAYVYGWGDLFSLSSFGDWLLNLANAGPALYFVLLVILLVFRFKHTRNVGENGLLLCALWALPILFLALSHYRDIRYAAPCFPAAGVAIGILLAPFLKRRSVAVPACLLLALPLANMLQTSFHLFGNRQIRMAAS